MIKKLKNTPTLKDVEVKARDLSSQDLLQLGMDRVVYIKPVTLEGVQAYAIQAADGTTLGVEESFDHAVGSVQNSDLDTVLLQ